MAEYDRMEILTKRVIYRVTGPIPDVELVKAIRAARMECAQIRGVPVEKLMDDAVLVETYDQDIHVFFDHEVKTEK